MRENNFLARLGGDEFAILLAHFEKNGGQRHIQAISDALDQHYVDYGGISIPVRASSIGTTSYGGEEAANSLVRRAGEAMYEIKRMRAVQLKNVADSLRMKRFNRAAE